MGVLLSVDAMVKQFGGVRAVDRASFEIEEGTITGLPGATFIPSREVGVSLRPS